MGKQSRSCSTSENSMRRNSNKFKMNAPMSSQKLKNKRKKNHIKTKNKLRKLLKHIRTESQSSLSLSERENTVIVLDNTNTPSNKRTLDPDSPSNSNRAKRRKNQSNDSLVIIDDNDSTNDIPTAIHTPQKPSTMQCSTPIAKDSRVLDFIPFARTNNNSLIIQNFNNDISNLTKEINNDSYITIDLTTETLNSSSSSKTQNTVIDLVNHVDNGDCTLVSCSNGNLSLSGESDVTVLNIPKCKRNKEKQMRKFANGIANLDASEKGRLLELITQNIFNGCNLPSKRLAAPEAKEQNTRATETVEDTYIKEVILGLTKSRNSIGSNIYNPEKDVRNHTGLRLVVIDGSNVAMEHSRGRVFSVKGLKICIDYFLKRGHAVKAFVPRFRCKFGKSTDPRLLDELARKGLVVYTPSREIQGRMITSYDDRYIVQCAAEFDGVIVSGDNYRDLLGENPRWRSVIENRLLPFTWVHDMIMFPKDPLGRNGPTLEQLLRHPVQATVTNN